MDVVHPWTANPAARRRRWRAGLLAFAVLPATNCTCANVVYQRAYAGALEDGCDAYRHDGGIEPVRRDAIEQLRGKGFTIDDAASKTTRIETKWREDGEHRERAIVELDDDATGTRVRATLGEGSLSAPRYEPDARERATELEAQVVRALVPSRSGESDAALLGHGFDLPARVLYEEAARVLAQRGELVEMRAETEPLRTGWRETSDRSARTRFEVRVVEIDDAHRRVDARLERERMIAGSRTWIPGASRRDLEFELALVDRRDPTAAAAIRSEAERKAQDAYETAVEHGAPSCGM